jgi:hypothetical protein
MDVAASLQRYGLTPSGADLDAVRGLLARLTEMEEQDHDDADTALMRLCCVQLFHAGDLYDVLAIWRAKTSSWDAHCSIDVQLLCGAGLPETQTHLAADGSPDVANALGYLNECVETGDFTSFTPTGQAESNARYYRDYLGSK